MKQQINVSLESPCKSLFSKRQVTILRFADTAAILIFRIVVFVINKNLFYQNVPRLISDKLTTVRLLAA